MERSRDLLVEALVAAVVLVTASCGGAEDRATSPSSSGVAASPTTTAWSGPTEFANPTASASPTGSPTSEPSATWHRSFDFSVEAVATDGEGNAYVTGLAPFGPAEGGGEPMAMMLSKTDPGGEQVWVKGWRSTSNRYPYAAGFDVAVSPDGSVVYVAGAVMNDSTEVRRGRLWAYSRDGDLLWSSGTSGNALTAVAASSTGLVGGGGGSLGAWGPDGDRLWVRSFEEPAQAHCDVVEDLAIGDQDEIFVVGSLDTTPTCGSVEGGAFEDADIVIQGRTSSGDLRWSTVLTDAGVTDNDRALAVDASGPRVFVAGQEDGSAWLARMSSGGEVSWQRTWDETESMAGAMDVALWGAVYVASSPGGLRRFTLAGDLTWERRLRLDEEEAPSGVATAFGRALYVTAGGGFSVWQGDLWRMRP